VSEQLLLTNRKKNNTAKEEFFGKSIWEISPESQEGDIFSRKMSEEKNISTISG